MAALSRPPGRMGRLWVLNRLDLAERGVTLLEQKLHLLTALQEELQRKAEQSRHDWQQACREADMWGLRAVLLGGQNAIDLAVTTAPASVTVQWAVTAGVRYPDVAACVLPPENDPAVIYPTSASVQATRAYRAARCRRGRMRCGAIGFQNRRARGSHHPAAGARPEQTLATAATTGVGPYRVRAGRGGSRRRDQGATRRPSARLRALTHD